MVDASTTMPDLPGRHRRVPEVSMNARIPPAGGVFPRRWAPANVHRRTESRQDAARLRPDPFRTAPSHNLDCAIHERPGPEWHVHRHEETAAGSDPAYIEPARRSPARRMLRSHRGDSFLTTWRSFRGLKARDLGGEIADCTSISLPSFTVVGVDRRVNRYE